MSLVDTQRGALGDRPVELTVDVTGVSEETYGVKHKGLPQVAELIGLVAGAFPEFIEEPNFKNWEMIGFTKADGVNYFENTIGVVYRGVPPKELLSKFTERWSQHSDFLDCYQIKYQLQSKTKVLKVYDATFGLYALPRLPAGVMLHTNHGVGLHFGSEQHEKFRDIYFAIKNPRSVSEYCGYYGIPYPKYDDDDAFLGNPEYKYGFGITYDALTLRPVKVKRYFFPHDPQLAHSLAK